MCSVVSLVSGPGEETSGVADHFADTIEAMKFNWTLQNIAKVAGVVVLAALALMMLRFAHC